MKELKLKAHWRLVVRLARLIVNDHERGKYGHDHLLLDLDNVLGQREYAGAYLARHGHGVPGIVHLGLGVVVALELLVLDAARLDRVDQIADDARVRYCRVLKALYERLFTRRFQLPQKLHVYKLHAPIYEQKQVYFIVGPLNDAVFVDELALTCQFLQERQHIGAHQLPDKRQCKHFVLVLQVGALDADKLKIHLFGTDLNRIIAIVQY